ncbi:MAG: UvrD-helicase domain-containing protein [Clostridia bacterium]|nr:UvrD-helicase domain-containing protein [Clostridia bacterium]
MDNLHTRYTKIKRALFDKVYQSRLNSMQCRAVFLANGPLLVLAGAGSGKTTVLVNRIAYLIKYGNAYHTDFIPSDVTDETLQSLEELLSQPPEVIEPMLSVFAYERAMPYSVLAITFTNKAAREIRTRLDAAFEDPTVSSSIWSGTFHSVCLRILRKFHERLGYQDNFSIYDTDDKKRMVKACMDELDIDEKRLSLRTVCDRISAAKDKLVPCDRFELTKDPRSADIARIYSLYERRMRENNALDFDDIIMRTVELFRLDPEVLDYYQRKFRYVLVDEYQDTNPAQFELTRLLSDGYRNIMVVGDDDQSIYRFRGATVENILGFDTTYPDATVVKLEQNYRSTANILAAANAVIKNNEVRHGKSLWCDKGDGERITVRECQDATEEGKFIVDTVNRMVSAGEAKYSDFAVLYRLNELARSLETTLAKSGVPYRILGGLRFYDRKEIKDIVAYLSLINSGTDNLRLKRIINEPKRKIGNATVEAIEKIAQDAGVSMLEVISRAGEYTALAKSAPRLLDFYRLITDIRARELTPSEIIGEIFETSGYKDMLLNEGFEGEGKIDNVNELIVGAIEYEKRQRELDLVPTLTGFLEEIALVSDVDKYDENADSIVLMTIHSAKGLEFPYVFLAGMEDGIFPSEQNMMSEVEMGEERRLAYVAITRAKERLYISYTKNRMMWGRTTYNMLSTFVRNEIPDVLLKKEGGTRTGGASRGGFSGRGGYGWTGYGQSGSAYGGYEVRRAPDGTAQKKRTAEDFGIARFKAGERVLHDSFGLGTVISSKDMGGDVLYEIEFDTVGKKKLMATFAKLKRA